MYKPKSKKMLKDEQLKKIKEMETRQIIWIKKNDLRALWVLLVPVKWMELIKKRRQECQSRIYKLSGSHSDYVYLIYSMYCQHNQNLIFLFKVYSQALIHHNIWKFNVNLWIGVGMIYYSIRTIPRRYIKLH